MGCEAMVYRKCDVLPSCEDRAEWGYEQYLECNQASLFASGVAA